MNGPPFEHQLVDVPNPLDEPWLTIEQAAVPALVYERDDATARDRCLGRGGIVNVPVPFPRRITRRLPNGRMVGLRFWGIRTDIDPPIPCYRITSPKAAVR